MHARRVVDRRILARSLHGAVVHDALLRTPRHAVPQEREDRRVVGEPAACDIDPRTFLEHDALEPGERRVDGGRLSLAEKCKLAHAPVGSLASSRFRSSAAVAFGISCRFIRPGRHRCRLCDRDLAEDAPQQLRMMEAEGIVRRVVHDEVPPKVEYGLTAWGQSLCPALDALLGWVDAVE